MSKVIPRMEGIHSSGLKNALLSPTLSARTSPTPKNDLPWIAFKTYCGSVDRPTVGR